MIAAAVDLDSKSVASPARAGDTTPDWKADAALLAELYAKHGLGSQSYARAAALVRRTGSIGAALSAPTPRLRKFGVSDAEMRLLTLLQSTLARALRRLPEERPLLRNLSSVIDYLHLEMAHRMTEAFRVLFLNGRLHLVHDEVMAIGSVASVEVHPRTIIARALEVNARQLLLVHNHPSGDPTPSREDIQLTARIREAGKMFDIGVLDHVVISQSGHVSLRAEELM